MTMGRIDLSPAPKAAGGRIAQYVSRQGDAYAVRLEGRGTRICVSVRKRRM